MAKDDEPSPREPGMPMTIREYAAYLRVSYKTINRLLVEGMPHLRVGNLIRVSPSVADAWMLERGTKRSERRAAKRKAGVE